MGGLRRNKAVFTSYLLPVLLGGKLSFVGSSPGAKLNPRFSEYLEDPHSSDSHTWGDLLGHQPPVGVPWVWRQDGLGFSLPGLVGGYYGDWGG